MNRIATYARLPTPPNSHDVFDVNRAQPLELNKKHYT